MFVRVEKRFSDGFSLLAHYTKSRFMDDVESANEYGIGGQLHGRVQPPARLGAKRQRRAAPLRADGAVRSADVRPTRAARAILGGWRVGVLETLQSGPPFTVMTTANTTNAFPAGALRPDLVGNPELPSSERTLSHWFNTAAFVNPAPFTFGNSPRSVLRGPGLATPDATVEKTIALGARTKFDVRVEAYNLLNRANFNIPGLTLGASDFGVVSSARPARTVQLGARLSF